MHDKPQYARYDDLGDALRASRIHRKAQQSAEAESKRKSERTAEQNAAVAWLTGAHTPKEK